MMSKHSTFYMLLAFLLIIGIAWYYLLYRPTHFQRLSLFPIEHYDQNINHWIGPDVDYDKPLLTASQQISWQQVFLSHYFGEESPWQERYVKANLKDLYSYVSNKINEHDNQHNAKDSKGYGENFRPYPPLWFDKLRQNINLPQFIDLKYSVVKRAIAIRNTPGRDLPTEEVYFYSPMAAGEGYPFDHLQAATIWVGTPLYILGETIDQAWSLVLSPNFVAWVNTLDIALADPVFVDSWLKQANETTAAITESHRPIYDYQKQFRFAGFVGMVFPAKQQGQAVELMIPVANSEQHAEIRFAKVPTQQVAIMPMATTPRHLVQIMQQLIGRPYGWGGQYFYNDCSSELKNLFTPFAIWLPNHSSNQVDPASYPVKQVDLSDLDNNKRYQYLFKYGHPFVTVVYIDGHVFLYLGNYIDPKHPGSEKVALTYQNIWGFKPRHRTHQTDRRSVVGGAVLLPLLKVYPEDRQLASSLDSPHFKLGYLDDISPDFVQTYLKQDKTIATEANK